MPFLFKTEIRQSAIHGRGVFASENIPRGSVYWVYDCPVEQQVPTTGYNPEPNNTYTKDQLQMINDPQRIQKIFYGGFYYEQSDIFIELRDGTNFMNHNQNYNSQIIYNLENDYKKLYSIAWKDIKAGDQITEFYGNYFSSKGKWVTDLMEKYSPLRLRFESSIASTQLLEDISK